MEEAALVCPMEPMVSRKCLDSVAEEAWLKKVKTVLVTAPVDQVDSGQGMETVRMGLVPEGVSGAVEALEGVLVVPGAHQIMMEDGGIQGTRTRNQVGEVLVVAEVVLEAGHRQMDRVLMTTVGEEIPNQVEEDLAVEEDPEVEDLEAGEVTTVI